MAHDDLLKSDRLIKKLARRFLVSLCIISFILPAWAADKSKDEETLRNAATVLQGMIDSKNVPADVLAQAKCIMVLPSVKKFGFGVGGSGGRGPMTCRAGKSFNGKWSAPAMYSVGGASLGLQVGGSETDFVLLIVTQKGVEAMLKGKSTLGRDATAAAGPSGATAAALGGGDDVLSYGRSSGLFAGASLGNANLEPDVDANKRLYGKEISAKEIVQEKAVKTTAGGQALVSLLNSRLAKHGD